MKKVLLTAVAVFAFGLTNAQDMKFGAKAGLNFASITNSDNAKMLTSFNVGVFGEFKISDKFAFQPEILFSGQGAKFESNGVSGTTNLNYINIPLMAKFTVAEGFSLQAGPQIGFLMSAKAGDIDVKEGLKSTDFALNFGAGYDITENIMVDLRYNLGLTDINKEAGDKSNKNSVIALSVGYKF